MQIDAISNLAPLMPAIKSEHVLRPNSVDFSKFLTESLENVNETVNKADALTKSYATGEMDNIHQVMISLSKAQTAMDLTVQVRNRLVDGAQELLRMSI